MRAWIPATLVIVPLLLSAGTASAQVSILSGNQSVLALDAVMEEGIIFVARGPNPVTPPVAEFHFNYRDLSIQQSTAIGQIDIHQLDIVDDPLDPVKWIENPEPEKWHVAFAPLSDTSIRSGQTGTGSFQVVHDLDASALRVRGSFTLRLRDQNVPANQSNRQEVRNVTQELEFYVAMIPTPYGELNRLSNDVPTVAPDADLHVPVTITNHDLFGETFLLSVDIVGDEANGVPAGDIPVIGTGPYYLEAGETQEVDIILHMPREKFWYYGVGAIAYIRLQPSGGGPEDARQLPFVIDGFYVSENYYFLGISFLGALLLLILLLVFAKRAYDRYLGKPLPPWVLPEERANLERLKREDPKSFYVLRYYTMEEEYRSALLWFFAYKKVSKRQMRQEMRALRSQEQAQELLEMPTDRYEHAFERVQRRYQRRMDRRKAWLERKVAGLEARLLRNFERDYQKDHDEWETKVEKLRKKQNKPHLRAHKKWQKQNERLLAKWEKPFRKKKEKYDKALAKAKEAYEKMVKKADKPTWRQWREAMENWEEDTRIRRDEGRAPEPEPVLFSAAVGPAELPEPFVTPPKPELPPEPQPQPLKDAPPEPTMGTPVLATSHYARKARKYERKAARKTRKLESKMAYALEDVNRRRRKETRQLASRRAELERAAKQAEAPSLVDRVLRRTPGDVERRHRKAYLKALQKQRTREAREHESNQMELAHAQAQRQEAEQEALLIRERATLQKVATLGTADERAAQAARIKILEQDLAALRAKNAKKLEEERQASAKRTEAAIAAIEKDIAEKIHQEDEARPEPAATASEA